MPISIYIIIQSPFVLFFKQKQNRLRLSKLPDKGNRIGQLHDKIVAEISSRNETDLAAALFSDLNIAEKGIETVTHMEWHGVKINDDRIATSTLDSDDDDDNDQNIDPLKIIAQSRNTVKLVNIVKPVKNLITPADLEDIKSFANETGNHQVSAGLVNVNSVIEIYGAPTNSQMKETTKIETPSAELEPHAIYVCQKDKSFDKNLTMRQKFLPFKTTKTDVHNNETEKKRVHGKHWEITAATPPFIRNCEAKLITLRESIEIERKHKDELKALQEKQAVKRLEARKKILADNISILPSGSHLLDPNVFFQSYRQRENKLEETSESEEEAFSDNSDNGDETETGGVTIPNYD